MAFKISEKNRKSVTVISIIAIILSIAFMIYTMFPPSPKINYKPFLAIGEVMAQEAARVLNNEGKVVLVVMDTGKFKIPTQEKQKEIFMETLKKTKVTVSAEVPIGFEEGGMPPEMGLSVAQYQKVISKCTPETLIVSFIGPPSLKEEEISEAKGNVPKMVAFAGFFAPQIKAMLENGIVESAIVPKMKIDPNVDMKKEPTTLRGWFDRSYQIVTKDNAAEAVPF